MSSFQNKRTISNKKSVVKAFCKVCQDSGKSEAEYTSHFVKSEPGPKGVVVCPTLLALVCTYCNGKSHTVKYCKELEKNKNKKEYQKNNMNYEKREKKENRYTSNNVFQVLAECEEKVVVEKFPPLSLSQLKSDDKVSSPFAFSYASMAAKPAFIVEKEKEKEFAMVFKDEKEIAKEKYLNNWLVRIDNEAEEYDKYTGEKKVTFAKSWAEWSDSEDDEMSISELY
jgi:hypothetical protein